MLLLGGLYGVLWDLSLFLVSLSASGNLETHTRCPTPEERRGLTETRWTSVSTALGDSIGPFCG